MAIGKLSYSFNALIGTDTIEITGRWKGETPEGLR